MIRKISLLFLLFTILMKVDSYSQTEDSVVILNEKIGPIISQETRDYYKLFSSISGYNYSIIYKTLQNKFFAKINITRNNKLADTILFFPEQSLLMLAEKVNNYEALLDGKYKMGENPPRLKFINRNTITAQEEEIIKKLKNALKINKPILNNAKVNEEKYVVFDSLDVSMIKKKMTEPSCAFGIGISNYSGNLDGINSALSMIEDTYRARGYGIGDHNPEFNFGAMISYGFKYCISPVVHLSLNASNTTNTDNKLFIVSLSGIYYPLTIGNEWFCPFIDFSVTFNYLRARKFYNDRISEVRSGGIYTLLDYIEADGEIMGFTLKTGAELKMLETFSLDLYLGYAYIPKMEVNAISGLSSTHAEVKLSNFMLGAMLHIYY